jgi:hypothetical protein
VPTPHVVVAIWWRLGVSLGWECVCTLSVSLKLCYLEVPSIVLVSQMLERACLVNAHVAYEWAGPHLLTHGTCAAGH